jgi:uncharacterized protein YoxC
VHCSSKEQEDKNRRLKKIDKAQKALEELIPKLNAYHLKTQKQITKAVNKIYEDVQGFSDLHKKVCELVEVPCSVYKNLHDGWWLFEGT